MEISKKKCVPCEGGVPPIVIGKAREMLKEVKGWELKDGKLSKDYKFESFMKSIDFVNKVAEIADSEGHHPDILIYYRKVNLTLYTHAISGLSENDFIVAAKINNLGQM
ncbi:4a-hydroxytetrahydrobiopterin dehydratase [Candidatus Woesearchaeota archaeon]|nr:4a-hydroxytetrahydrobiopterin dehydratase [Candidatus Woesearchaeota archaeon]